MNKKNILLLLLLSFSIFTSCNAEGKDKNTVIEMKSSNEEIIDYTYYESEDARLIMQYPKAWERISVTSTKEDFGIEELTDEELSAFTKQIEDSNLNSIWLIGSENNTSQINYAFEEIVGLSDDLLEDESFLEEFLDQNDYDVIQTFGSSGSLNFIEESKVRDFGDNKFIYSHYQLTNETNPDNDIHIVQVVTFARDRKHFLLLFTNEEDFDEMNGDLETSLSSFEFF